MATKRAAKALSAASQPDDGLDAETRTIYKLMADSKQYAGQTVVLKTGGEVVGNDNAFEDIAVQVDFCVGMMKQKMIVVNGGGPQINKACEERGIPIRKDPHTGYRITDPETLKICDEIMAQQERRIVSFLNRFAPSVNAVGMPGYAGRLVKAALVKGHEYTGECIDVDVQKIMAMLDAGITPVISSLAYHPDLGFANVNADPFAGFIATRIGAKRLILCSNTDGIWDTNKKRIPEILTSDVPTLLSSGAVTGGMIPKIETAFAVASTMPAGAGVAIINGLRRGTLVQELYSAGGSGTLIKKPEMANGGASQGFSKLRS
ncbi:MAG: acetylglutamate kinase [Proteobacteria bacterium]|nr:acetylglutamate kinase [Pseudomonadota bacterium]